MPLIYNGTNIDKVIYNGVELDKVIYNGVVVYESIDYNRSYFFIKNPTAEYLEFKIRFNAISATESNPLNIYYYVGEDIEKPTDPSTSITSSGSKTLTFGLEGDNAAIIEFAGSQFGEYNTSYALFYDNQELLTRAIIGTNCVDEYRILNDNNNLTEIVFAAIDIPFSITNAPKLTNIDFITNPRYIGYINNTGLTSFTVPANVTSVSQIARNSALKTLTILPTNIQMGQNHYSNNTVLEHMYVYTTAESIAKSTSYIYSWVYGSNPNLVIHLPATLNMTQAQTLFGQYFNSIDSTHQATVLFDL